MWPVRRRTSSSMATTWTFCADIIARYSTKPSTSFTSTRRSTRTRHITFYSPSTGRVSLILAGQRATQQWTGGGGVRANLSLAVTGRMARDSETRHVSGAGCPDRAVTAVSSRHRHARQVAFAIKRRRFLSSRPAWITLTLPSTSSVSAGRRTRYRPVTRRTPRSARHRW